jgi:hypothetical protein
MTDTITTADLTLGAPVSTVNRLGQATAIEQSRAVAEVQAAVYLARQFPRDEAEATRSMENSCRQMFVAESAFYRLPRAGGAVTGPTIQLAKELARCWGHIHYGPGEMDRTADRSEMLVYAWDVQSGTRAFSTFIVPHKRDKKNAAGTTVPVDLITMQEIYENNANQAARRLREQIFGVLPSWFTERAKQLCRETLDAGDGSSLEDRRAGAIAGFGGLGITVKQLEKKLDLQALRWTGHELGQLAVIFRAITAGEISKDVEFPPDATAITTKDITGAEPKPAPVESPAPQPVEQKDPAGESVSQPENADAGTVPTEPTASTPEPKSQGGYEVTEQTDVTADELPGPGTPPAAGQPPSGKGTKARRAQITALVTMLKDNGVKDSSHDLLAVVSLLLDERLPALSDLTAEEVTYLYSRIPELVSGGDFAGTIERALTAAKDAVQAKGSDFTEAAGG